MSVFSSIIWECVWVKPKESLKHYSEASHWPAGGLSSIWAVWTSDVPPFLPPRVCFSLPWNVSHCESHRQEGLLTHVHSPTGLHLLHAEQDCSHRCVCVYDKLHAKNSTDLQETTKQYKQIRTLLVCFLFTNSQMQVSHMDLTGKLLFWIEKKNKLSQSLFCPN